MVEVHYFANIREVLGIAQEQLPLPVTPTVVGLIEALAARHGDRWQNLFGATKLLAAVNQVVVPLSAPIKDGDEVAFFPPVTGG